MSSARMGRSPPSCSLTSTKTRILWLALFSPPPRLGCRRRCAKKTYPISLQLDSSQQKTVGLEDEFTIAEDGESGKYVFRRKTMEAMRA